MFSQLAYSQTPFRFDKAWWNQLTQDEQWDFIYGFTDCGRAIQSGLNMVQYDNFISEHVNSDSNSVPKLIRLAPHKVRALPQIQGGEVWTEQHGFNDGDLWGNNVKEGRAWVEGYLACENRPSDFATVNRYVRLLIRHYADPRRHKDKLADVLKPLLPVKKLGMQK